MTTKGLYTLFVAAIALLGVTTASATAPVISTIPDVIIGDAENNGPSDNNFFVFTDAFKFDDYVQDDLTADASLKWSFDEGDDPAPLSGATNWYTINGKTPVHVGTAAAIGDTSGTAAHVNPALINELRVTSTTATFRDIVFSPTPGSGPYPDPAGNPKTAHQTGKVVRFFVSDGTYAATKDIIVKTIDNASDQLVNVGVTPFRTDSFTTNGSGTTWVTGGATSGNTSYNNFSYDATTGAYRIVVNSVANKFRFAYWNNQRADWLPYSVVGSTKYVRAKYYMYNSGSNTASNTLGTYNVPNFNLKLMQRFAITSEVFIQTHDTTQSDLPFYKELAPSTNPATPSLYRVDFDPIDVPYMATASAILPNSQPEEGIQSSFEIFSIFPEDSGTLAMTELAISTYPKSALAVVKATQSYGSALLAHANSTSLDVDQEFDSTNAPNPGDLATVVIPGAGVMSASGVFPVTFNTSAVAANRVGNLERTFYAGDDQTARMRVAENEQYTIRWHLTSSASVSTQATIWLKTRSAKFGYSNYLQLAGGTTPGANGDIARQAGVGVGSLNPDKISTENGGYYTQLFNTPLDGDIRADVAGTLAVKMPNLGNPALPGRGSATASAYRDIRITAIAYDTLTSAAANPNQGTEVSNFTIDDVLMNAYDRVAD
jgi:hypothetical protein